MKPNIHKNIICIFYYLSKNQNQMIICLFLGGVYSCFI